MLKLKQTPLSLIGIFAAMGFADGEPTPEQLATGLILAIATMLYVFACIIYNEQCRENR